MFSTLGVVPIIRCPRGNAAEMVSEKLDKKMRDNIRDARNSLFTTDMHSAQMRYCSSNSLQKQSIDVVLCECLLLVLGTGRCVESCNVIRIHIMQY